MADLEPQKKQAALKALEHIESGMNVGLGTGSTAKYFIQALGEKLKNGALRDISAVATSEATAQMAQDLGIPLQDPLQDFGASSVDVAIDGMDEVTDTLDAIKGLGGALAREKVVAGAGQTLYPHRRRHEAGALLRRESACARRGAPFRLASGERGFRKARL